MGQQVKMPDGVVVEFPDDMPRDEIKALIEDRFPDAAKGLPASSASDAQAAANAKSADELNRVQVGNIPFFGPALVAVSDIQRGLDAGGGVSPQDEAAGWERNTLLPRAMNLKTGEQKLAVPGLLQGVYDAAKSAVTLPGDVLDRKYEDPMNPGRLALTPELIGRGLDATSFMLDGGAPSAALKATERGSGAALSAEKFGVPLSRGQASGEIGQLTKEEVLRQTAGAGQSVMRNFDERQGAAIDAAAKGIGKGIGGAADNMPEVVQGGLRDKVAFSKQRAGSLYNIAEDGGLTFKPEAVAGLPKFVDDRLAADSVLVDEKITPTAAVALGEIEKAGKLRGGLDQKGGPPVLGQDGVESFDVTLKGMEQVRKRLVTLQGSTPEDRRAVSAIKRAYDAWMDDAVDQALISGDETALDALKAARKETQVYKGLTEPKPGDTAARSVAKMQKMDATAEEVANWLYGADIARPTLDAPKVAAKLKNTFGPDSKEFQAIRASAWVRLVRDLRDGDMLSPTKVANRIEDFLNVKGSTLSQVLFTDAERGRMKEFADVLRKTVTPADAKNPSRTAFTMKGLFNTAVQAAAGWLGFQTGGGTGALVALVGLPVFRNIAGYRAAAKAVSGGAPRSARGVAALGLQGAARGAALMPQVKTEPARGAALMRLET